jgi:hypothetical protein
MTFQKLDLFPSLSEGVRETPTPLGPLERSAFNHWTTYGSITTATETPRTRLCQREMTEKYAIKTVIKHAQTWN